MSYILNKTNGAIVATVQDASIDRTTDLVFLGRNYAGYGEIQNENFLKLLENFANTTAPSVDPNKAIEGQIWYDTANKHLNFWDSAEWKSVANLEVSTADPTITNTTTLPPAGNLWYNSLEEQLFASNGAEYVLIGPPIGADTKAGWRGSYEQDAVQPGAHIFNIKAVIGSDVVSVVSNQEYTVHEDASGPYPIYDSSNNPRLRKGINLIGADAVTGESAFVDPVTGAYSSGTVLWGTAAHAIYANSATTAGASSFTVSAGAVDTFQPVPFITISDNLASLNIEALSGTSFAYNANTHRLRATTFQGVATSALYADLAERYETDAVYDTGTVLVIGGEKEVTTTAIYADTRVAGIVSKHPAYMMNSDAGTDETHPYIALKGRVPCKVVGLIKKGDLLVTSIHPGFACAGHSVFGGAIIGKALENHSEGFGVIEVLVV
jgi:hypothetical protein